MDSFPLCSLLSPRQNSHAVTSGWCRFLLHDVCPGSHQLTASGGWLWSFGMHLHSTAFWSRPLCTRWRRGHSISTRDAAASSEPSENSGGFGHCSTLAIRSGLGAIFKRSYSMSADHATPATACHILALTTTLNSHYFNQTPNKVEQVRLQPVDEAGVGVGRPQGQKTMRRVRVCTVDTPPMCVTMCQGNACGSGDRKEGLEGSRRACSHPGRCNSSGPPSRSPRYEKPAL